MKKNILFAYITPFHPERGGIGRVTHTLTLELLKRGYKVFYLIYPCGMTIRHEYDYPAPLTYLPSSDLLSSENIQAYHQYLKDNQIDIVINQSGNFSDSQLWLNTGNDFTKVISVLHSNPWVAYKHLWSSDVYPLRNDSFMEKCKRIARICLYPKIKKQFKESRVRQFEYLLPRADKVCLLSAKYYGELSEICPGYESKYCAIPNPNSYSEETLKATKCSKKKQVLFVGLFGPQKREDRLLQIWKKIYQKHPDWELIMVGDGPAARVNRLKHMVKGIPNVRFTGFANPLPYFQEASIFCMTSNYEGWPMVLPEAMQCGTVPIAFDSFASASDIISDGRNGFLISPFDTDAYIDKLCTLMEDADLLHRMSEAASKDVQQFSVENVVDLWEKLF